MNKLYRLNDDSFVLTAGKNVASASTVTKIIPFMVQFGFSEEAIIESITSLAKKNHSVAEFGSFSKIFLFSRGA